MKDERPSSAAEMAAFDALPPELRQAVAYSPFNMRAPDILGALGCMAEREVRRMIRNTAPKFVQAESNRWWAKYHRLSPHVLAGATVMVTEPLDGLSRPLRQRELRRLRDPVRVRAEDAARFPPPPDPEPPRAKPPDVICL